MVPKDIKVKPGMFENLRKKILERYLLHWFYSDRQAYPVFQVYLAVTVSYTIDPF